MSHFFIIVTDRDNKTFNVLGPMMDDTKINEEVVKLQKLGRAVNCHTPGSSSREEIIERVTKELVLNYTDIAILGH